MGFLFSLVKLFWQFVEDQPRRCDVAVTAVANIDLGAPNYGDDDDWDGSNKDISPIWAQIESVPPLAMVGFAR